ncbi:hypothetical protein GA0115239_100652 [Streptomyces sp. BpilaLS-43]|nr:hypothetical protein GA0115239_100652 [Streptomyces sp. BpilaLS-43]
MHVLSDANGLPLLVRLTAGNAHDSLALKPMIRPTAQGDRSAVHSGPELRG